MARVKRGTKARARRKRVMNRAEGFRGRRKNNFTLATNAVDKALQYAFVGRKQRKRNLRRLWVERLNAASRACGVTYSKLIPMLKKAGIEIDRKILAEIAVVDPKGFEKIVASAKASV
jgi:large subunit ribosomal protein L20